MTDEQRLIRYREALERIAALGDAKEVRGGFEDIEVPDHIVKEGGWVPIHPRTLAGLRHASIIAKAALDDGPNSGGRT